MKGGKRIRKHAVESMVMVLAMNATAGYGV
jgi:hypothetical protein